MSGLPREYRAEVLRRVICKVRDRFISAGLAMNAADINHGLCEKFARTVLHEMENPRWLRSD
jgi:hypothetical protein